MNLLIRICWTQADNESFSVLFLALSVDSRHALHVEENSLQLLWRAVVPASPGSGGLLHDLVDRLGKLLRVHARTLPSSSPMLRIFPKVLGNSMPLVRQVLCYLAWVPLPEIDAVLSQLNDFVPTQWPICCCQGEDIGQFPQEHLDGVEPSHINRSSTAALENSKLRDDFFALFQQLVAIVAIKSASMVLFTHNADSFQHRGLLAGERSLRFVDLRL